MRARPSLHGMRRQRGAALLTAMIIVTLVATLAASMVWQQWRAVQVEAAERTRVQSAWILLGGLDYGRLILREASRSGITALGQPWSTTLEESRISTFLAADKSSADDGPEAFLSGGIVDAQARYNLRNLLAADKAAAGLELETLVRLCEFIGIETGVAQRIADGLRSASTAATANAPLMPLNVDQLAWLGIDTASIEALRPFVVLLPEATSVNVNTAPREVLAAAIKGLDLATAERLTRTRPFKNTDELKVQLGTAPPPGTNLDVRSSYFLVSGRLRLADRVLSERSLVRVQSGQSVVLQRERIASVEQTGS